MRVATTIICTDYGNVTPSWDVEQIIKAARMRKDGQPDMRFTYGKLAQFCIEAAKEQAKAEYMAAIA